MRARTARNLRCQFASDTLEMQTDFTKENVRQIEGYPLKISQIFPGFAALHREKLGKIKIWNLRFWRFPDFFFFRRFPRWSAANPGKNLGKKFERLTF
jgi:hypothetical protein